MLWELGEAFADEIAELDNAVEGLENAVAIALNMVPGQVKCFPG